MIEWAEFVKWLFFGLLGCAGMYAVWILQKILDNQIELNKNLAVVVTRVDGHEKRLDRLEEVKS